MEEKLNEILIRALETCPEEVARNMGDCRYCRKYSYDSDVEVDYLDCSKDYFHYVDYGGGREEGELHWFGCDGKDFLFSEKSIWWRSYWDSAKKGERLSR